MSGGLLFQDKTRILATAKKIRANATKTEASLQARADKAEARVTELEQQAAGGAPPAADGDVISAASAEAAVAAEARVVELQQQLTEAEAAMQKAKADQEAAQVALLAAPLVLHLLQHDHALNRTTVVFLLSDQGWSISPAQKQVHPCFLPVLSLCAFTLNSCHSLQQNNKHLLYDRSSALEVSYDAVFFVQINSLEAEACKALFCATATSSSPLSADICAAALSASCCSCGSLQSCPIA